MPVLKEKKNVYACMRLWFGVWRAAGVLRLRTEGMCWDEWASCELFVPSSMYVCVSYYMRACVHVHIYCMCVRESVCVSVSFSFTNMRMYELFA